MDAAKEIAIKPVLSNFSDVDIKRLRNNRNSARHPGEHVDVPNRWLRPLPWTPGAIDCQDPDGGALGDNDSLSESGECSDTLERVRIPQQKVQPI